MKFGGDIPVEAKRRAVKRRAASLVLFAVCSAALLSAVPFTTAPAQAGEESADAEITLTPKFGDTFFSNAFSAADGTVTTTIRLPGPAPAYPKITPLKVSDLRFPPSSVLTFRPKPSMPVCPDDQLGPPPTSNSIPVPNMIARCPQALIGNGTARFALAKNNSASAGRDGEVLIFNGGLVDGLPKIKVYAYSYDLMTGIYTSSILQPDGQLRFEIPYLPVDSAVTAIELSIPGRKVIRPKPAQDLTVTLPPGRDPNYLQVKCVDDDGLPWTTDLTLGERDDAGPIGPPEFTVSDSGVTPCTGVLAVPRLSRLRFTAPRSAVRGRPVSFRVRVQNTGAKTVTGGRLLISGRGLRARTAVGEIAPGRSKSVLVRSRFKARGMIPVSARLSTSNAGNKSASKRVRVR
jgi:hypothetical protein